MHYTGQPDSFNPDNVVEFQRTEFRCLTGKVCQRLAGIKTSQRQVKPCQPAAGRPGTGNCNTALFGFNSRLFPKLLQFQSQQSNIVSLFGVAYLALQEAFPSLLLRGKIRFYKASK